MTAATPLKKETYETGGGKNTTHGTNYHLSLLMFTFLKGLKGNDDYSMATEMAKAGKFDDVIYRYTADGRGKKIYRLIQVKHKLDPQRSRITLSALLSKSPKSDLGMIMYLDSFRDMKSNFSEGDEEIRDLIVYTNGRFKWRDKMIARKGGDEGVTFVMKDAFEKRRNDEGEVVMDELLQTELYSFAEDAEERRKWAKYLMENSSRKDGELEEDVELFLNKLSMAIDQPEEKVLNEMITDELKSHLNSNVQEAFSQYHTYMHRWLTGKESFYLDREDGLKLIDDMVRKYGGLKFGLDRPVLNFTGREKELDDLWRAFVEGKRRIVICGLGGVGKTQLAKKFVERHSESYSCIAWMEARCQEDLQLSFERLAFDKLGIVEERADGKPKDIESVLEEVKRYLQSRKSIFVFDNVRYMVEGSLDVFLKKLPGDAALLMTSRCRDWDNFFIYPLEQLSDGDATRLIGNSLKDHIKLEDEQVSALARELQNYPLAIQQAIACIKRRSKTAKRRNATFDIDAYLELFHDNFKSLLQHDVQKHNEDAYLNTTMTTWDVTVEDVKKEEGGTLSEKLLHAISYFYPDGIPISDVVKCFGAETENDVIASLQLLDDYCMVDVANVQFTVHRLVQKITRLRLKESGGEDALLESVLRVCKKLDVRNVVTVWEHCAGHEDLIRRHSRMPTDFIWKLIKKGRYADAYVYGKKLMRVLESVLVPTDTSLILMNNTLELLTQMQGVCSESYDVYMKAYENSRRILGKKNRLTEKVKNWMEARLQESV